MIDSHSAMLRRQLLRGGAALAAASGAGITRAVAQQHQQQGSAMQSSSGTATQPPRDFRSKMVGYMLAHEQFPVPELVQIGQMASRVGFHALATSDHLQPWQANEGHSGQAWVTLGALGAVTHSWMGTTVTCPLFRYNPAVVAEAFASLNLLYPQRIFLGVGSGEALNERAATGDWPKWQERWDRLIEAIAVIRQLWRGQDVAHKGRYYNVEAKLYDPPATPIPLLTAANGRKSMRLAGQHGDGLVTDPHTWQQHKAEWEAGARAAGKNPAQMPVLVEQYVVVGGEAEAKQAAERWRFGPKAFKSYYNITSPVEIQRQADAQLPLEQVTQGWPISTDPKPHIQKIQELFDSGVSFVNIHAGQMDQKRVIAFYGDHVLPRLGLPA